MALSQSYATAIIEPRYPLPKEAQQELDELQALSADDPMTIARRETELFAGQAKAVDLFFASLGGLPSPRYLAVETHDGPEAA